MFEINEEKAKAQNQNVNSPFLTPSKIGARNSPFMEIGNRIQGWQLNDDIFEVKETLTKNVEDKLNDIDDGTEKLTRYSNVKEYLQHVDKILED